jgi:hypothetical protein
MLSVGAASKEITPDPEEEVPLIGYGDPMDRTATGIHDPLFAKAVVVSDGGSTVGIISADVLGIPRKISHYVRSAVSAEGIRLDDVVVTGTHTHAGPYIPRSLAGYSIERDVSDIVDGLRRAFVDVLSAAVEDVEPAVLRVGSAANRTAAVNRRERGGVNGGVRLPRGEIDPEVLTVEFERESGPNVVVFNYACHPVCTTPAETLVSADWPGYVHDRLRDEEGVLPLFVNGPAGDINPRGRYDAERAGSEVYAYMEEIGNDVAETVLEALSDGRDAPGLADISVSSTRETVDLPLKRPPEREIIVDRLEELDRELDRLSDEYAGFDIHYNRTNSLYGVRKSDRRYASTLLELCDYPIDHLKASVHYVEFGELGIVAFPGEAFVQYGLDLKRQASADTLLVAGYANEYAGYIPTLSELDNGGYEINVCLLAPEGIQRLQEASERLVSAY